MTLASIKSRIERLERQSAGKTAVVIPFRFDPATRRFSSEPSADDFAAMAFRQQTELQAMIARMTADLEEPPDATAVVGTEQLAPLPAGVKRPRFIEINGQEFDAQPLRRN